MFCISFMLCLAVHFGSGSACLQSYATVNSNQSGILYYYYHSIARPFTTAQSDCHSRGENLPYFETQSELDEYNVLITGCGADLWLGINSSANIPASSYKNVDGTTPVITNWGAGQPANGGIKTCAMTPSSYTTWSNDDCTLSKANLCFKRINVTTTTTKPITTTTTLKSTTRTTAPKVTTSTNKMSTTSIKKISTTSTTKKSAISLILKISTSSSTTPLTSSSTTSTSKTSTSSSATPLTSASTASTSKSTTVNTQTTQTRTSQSTSPQTLTTSTLSTRSETSLISTSLAITSTSKSTKFTSQTMQTKKYRSTPSTYQNCTGTPLTSWSDCFADDCTKSDRGKRNRTYVKPEHCYGDLTYSEQCTADCDVPDPLSPTERIIATVFQTTGCIVLLCLLGAVFSLFVMFRVMFLERMLHMCQEIALLIGHAAILLFMEIKPNKKIACSIAGIILQYSFVANYTFLMLEGIQTYCTLTKVVTTEGFFSAKINLAIGWLLPFGITGVTAAFKFDKYPSKYSCWLNMGDMICAGTVVPLAIAVWSTAILTEAAAMDDVRKHPLTPQEKYIAAHVSQKMMVLKLVFNVLSWIFGMWSMYAQNVYLFGTVSALNMSLGCVIFLAHTSCNEKVIGLLKMKFCKKK